MKEMAFVFAMGIAFMVALWFASAWFGSIGCDNLREETGLPTKYVTFTCYVKVNGQWMPVQNWRPVGQ